MKKTLLFLALVIFSIGNLIAQSVAITSVNSNPAEVNGDVTLDIEYTSTSGTDALWIGLVRKDSDGGWLETIADNFINPLSSGTDASFSQLLSIPAATTLSADLTGGEYYGFTVSLSETVGWTEIAGDYSVTIELVGEGTLGIEDEALGSVKVFYNNNKINISGLSIDDYTLKVFDLSGRLVQSIRKENNQNLNLASALYIVKLEAEGIGVKTSKIIVN